MIDAEQYLSARGISEDVAEAAGLFEVPNARTIYPARVFSAAPAIVIPYHTIQGEPLACEVGGEEEQFARVRYMDEVKGPDGKVVRYQQPPRTGCQVYFPPIADWPAIADDTGVPILITEGEMKALAACAKGIWTAGLGGVSSVMRDGKFLPELATDIKWRGRQAYICFDSDAVTNPQVAAAEGRLANTLQSLGARVTVVRLPAADDGGKQGLDDYLVEHDVEEFLTLCGQGESLGALDAKVLALNAELAWISREGKPYDMRLRHYTSCANIVRGERFASLTHVMASGKGQQTKTVSVAECWLKHPHALRYNDMLFQPGGDPVIQTPEGPALNLFQGLAHEEGDVTPWLELTEFLFQDLPPEHRDLPVKFFAWKFQHLDSKWPLSFTLVGPYGTGKSMWAGCLKDAFGGYGSEVPSDVLKSEFNGWEENCLLAVVNDPTVDDISKGKNSLKTRISEKRRRLNEKYRVPREMETFYTVCILANDHAVASILADDRRSVIAETRDPLGEEVYAKVAAWRDAGGGRKLAHYFMTYDLQGWTPPPRAPMTAAKALAYTESLTPVQRIAHDAKTASVNVIRRYLDAVYAWADQVIASGDRNNMNRAQESMAAFGEWTVRPFYTADELVKIFPMLVTSGGFARSGGDLTAGRLSRQLRDAGLPMLKPKDNPDGFMWHGRRQHFLVLADIADWREPISQADFDRYMTNCPPYRVVKGASKLTKTAA
jgi:hypothetical protein